MAAKSQSARPMIECRLKSKDAWFTFSLETALADCKAITSENVAEVPYPYLEADSRYFVSENGRFFQVRFMKSAGRYAIQEMAWHRNRRNPYVMARVCEKKRVCLDIARCVYAAFMLKAWPPDKTFINYKDGDRTNPSLSNLIPPRGSEGERMADYCALSYKENYDRFVKWVRFETRLPLEMAQDCVSTAFVNAFSTLNPYARWLKSKDTIQDEKYKREVLWRDWSWQLAVMAKCRYIKMVREIDNMRDNWAVVQDAQDKPQEYLAHLTGPGQKRVMALFLAGYSDKEIMMEMGYTSINSVRGMFSKAVCTLRERCLALN